TTWTNLSSHSVQPPSFMLDFFHTALHYLPFFLPCKDSTPAQICMYVCETSN
ncbi:unnamed protein product, partial [Bubo scandiacus]